MKKTVSLVMVCAMVFAMLCLVGCGKDDADKATTQAPTTVASTTVVPTEAPTPAPTKAAKKGKATLFVESDDGIVAVEGFASKKEMSFDEQEDYVEAKAEANVYKVKVDAYNIVIPDTVKGMNIQAISDDAFENCKNIKSITIPETVRMIENGAFRGCSPDLVLKVTKDSAGLEFAKAQGIKYKIVK